ncbi:stage III sporulation protein AE [Alkaliphilus hydrothermalis]|uniref:Stage III sporulation protein AE n=1 Tax=Alkaliphilus hydrothermalis TaxID=1482730 RepID=A0ABS2NM51_9FIRM|nr:stage III sporulation protein AE [Alkaliphilus hydrothermalis]MBM7613999.1 stage III sporulation protein AE [Alkaliphilus hydrothermalis]
MKKLLIITLLVYLLMTPFVLGAESKLTPENIIMEQIDRLDTGDLQMIMESINRDLGEHMPRLELKGLILKLLKGEGVISLKELVQVGLQVLFKEVVANWVLLTQIIVLSSIYAILSNLQNAFENDIVGKLAYSVCYLVIITLTIKSFLIALTIGREAIDLMVTFMHALLPVLLAILLAMGGITSSAFFHPVLLGAVGFVGTVVKTLVLPLIFFSTVLSIVNNFSSKIQITKLAGLLRQLAVMILGSILTAFIGVISIQGITAASVDGVTMRTAKFAVDKFIPIVGGFLSDAMDTVVGCSLLLKNAIGAIGLITVFLICLIPMIKIIALIVIYKLCAAVIEPIAQKQLVDCLNQMSNALVLLFATVSSVAIMFFITITIIVGTGNITLMMR